MWLSQFCTLDSGEMGTQCKVKWMHKVRRKTCITTGVEKYIEQSMQQVPEHCKVENQKDTDRRSLPRTPVLCFRFTLFNLMTSILEWTDSFFLAFHSRTFILARAWPLYLDLWVHLLTLHGLLRHEEGLASSTLVDLGGLARAFHSGFDASVLVSKEYMKRVWEG